MLPLLDKRKFLAFCSGSSIINIPVFWAFLCFVYFIWYYLCADSLEREIEERGGKGKERRKREGEREERRERRGERGKGRGGEGKGEEGRGGVGRGEESLWNTLKILHSFPSPLFSVPLIF